MAIQIIIFASNLRKNKGKHRPWKFCFVTVVVTRMIHYMLLFIFRLSLKLSILKRVRENVQVSEVMASFSFSLLLSLKTNGAWRVALSPHLLEWPILMLVETLLAWWDCETSLKHLICLLFWERSLFFSLNSLNIVLKLALVILIHLFLCGGFMSRLKVLKAAVIFQIDCSVNTCWI